MGEHTTEAESLERVAQYTANYLSTILSSNMILGIAWGTTTSAISRNLVPKTTHHSQIVQLNGAGNTESLGIEYASEILMRFAQNFRATYHLFPVPAFFDRVETKKSLWEETSIKRILELQTRADIWLYSIGSVSAGIPSHLHADGYLKKADYSDLKRLDIAGDIATVFFREDGSYHNIQINQRSSGPSLELLKHKRGICVISGQAKLKGLMAAIRGKLLSELILDEPTAGLDPLMQHKFFNLIRQENKRGATVFFSSHILGEVQRMCNRVAIIKEGSIINIQDIKTLQKDNYKKIRVTAEGVAEVHFDLPGVTKLEHEDGTLSFFFKGDINLLMRRISENEITDVTIEDLTLEEIFMHYYE